MATNLSVWTLLWVFSRFQNAKKNGNTYKIPPCTSPVGQYMYCAGWKVIERWETSNYPFASCSESNSISQDLGSLFKVLESCATLESVLVSFSIYQFTLIAEIMKSYFHLILKTTWRAFLQSLQVGSNNTYQTIYSGILFSLEMRILCMWCTHVLQALWLDSSQTQSGSSSLWQIVSSFSKSMTHQSFHFIAYLAGLAFRVALSYSLSATLIWTSGSISKLCLDWTAPKWSTESLG